MAWTQEERALIERISNQVQHLEGYVRGVVEGREGLLVRLALVEQRQRDDSDDDRPAGPTLVPAPPSRFALPDLATTARVGLALGTLIGAVAMGVAGAEFLGAEPANAPAPAPQTHSTIIDQSSSNPGASQSSADK